jgi:hypothetical protein
MSSDERRGRFYVLGGLGSLLVWLGLGSMRISVQHPERAAFTWGLFLMCFLMCLLIFRGSRLAALVFGFLLVLSATVTVFIWQRVETSWGQRYRDLASVGFVLCCWAAAVLPPSTRAFLAYQRRGGTAG